jgi:UDP-N-acetyl-D-galactosamine dehydrogenase
MPTIAVIGLGYVGLPLAVSLAKHYKTIGFDIDARRVAELTQQHDRTNELTAEDFAESSLRYTCDINGLPGYDIYIVTVPTPVTNNNKPDLTAIRNASQTVGQVIKKGAIVVFESTVYPGVTEDICGPIISEVSGLAQGADFFLGYSPERINPGDKQHTVETITKVVAGENADVAKLLAEVYGKITEVFVARNIKTAEAAKVIENAQRDINIAFINAIAMIFNKMNLSVYDVLDAAGTKWNFLPFKPGLVGGHCIGVDPYYLAECSKQLGHNPEIILAGRRINDSMGKFIAGEVNAQLPAGQSANILVLGLTFKENVPDLRNSKVIDVINELRHYGHRVAVHDAHASAEEAKKYYDIDLVSLDKVEVYDCVVLAVPHDEYKSIDLAAIAKENAVIADIKGIMDGTSLPASYKYWKL